jgi:hypothetical protein
MAICPFAKQEPVSNHGGPIGAILGVVDHVTAGESDPWGYFANPANQVSSHFFIGNGQGGVPDGEIVQYDDTEVESWAQAAGNVNYISVETEGVPGEPLTQAQVLSFARLYVWLFQTHGCALVITDNPGSRGFITHGDGGAAWGGHTGCPGDLRKAQRGQILYIAALELNPTPPPGAQEGPNMQCEDDTSGGVWTLGADGHVEAIGGAPYIGGMGGNRWGWQALGTLAGISGRKDGNGQQGFDVAIALTHPNADGTWFDHYTFPRNGSLKAVKDATHHLEDVLAEGAVDVPSPTGKTPED